VSSIDIIWERILFYAARLTTEQLKSGINYQEIQKAISIIIVDWNLTREDSGYYHNRFRLYDENTGCRFPDLFEINTLELPKLPLEADGTILYNWLRLFTAETEEEMTMVAKSSPEIAQAVGVIMELSEDERTRLLAEAREKYRRDEVARRDYAYDKGKMEGRREERQEIALAALQNNISPEDVASFTGLSLEEIKALAATLPPASH
jgi:predicted transposase/invertase (TIGR01784 family)